MRGYLHTSADRDVIRVAIGDPPERADAGQGADAASQAAEDTGTATEKTETAPDTGSAQKSQPLDPYAALPDKDPPENLIQVGVETLRDNYPVAIELLGHPGDASKHTADETGQSGRATVCNVPLSEGFVEVAVSRPRGVESASLSRGYDYQLFSVDVLPNLSAVEVEPNDSREEADKLGALETGESGERTGFITSTDDRDVYAFRVGDPNAENGSPRAKATVDAGVAPGNEPGEGAAPAADAGTGSEEGSARSPAGPVALSQVQLALKVKKLDLRFTVTDATGAPIAKVDRAGPASDEKTQLDLPDGVYFVSVESRRAGSCNPYQLSARVR
jgi:hypothetical protein